MSQVVGLPNNSYKPITNTAQVGAWFGKLQKGCTRLAAASAKVYQQLARGRWFSPCIPASSTKTGIHDIHVAKIQLKVALKHQKSNQINHKDVISTERRIMDMSAYRYLLFATDYLNPRFSGNSSYLMMCSFVVFFFI